MIIIQYLTLVSNALIESGNKFFELNFNNIEKLFNLLLKKNENWQQNNCILKFNLIIFNKI